MDMRDDHRTHSDEIRTMKVLKSTFSSSTSPCSWDFQAQDTFASSRPIKSKVVAFCDHLFFFKKKSFIGNSWLYLFLFAVASVLSS